MNLSKPFFLALCIATSSYLFAENAAFVAPGNERFKTQGEDLMLDNAADSCILRITSGNKQLELPLRLSSPCYWVTKDKSQEPLQYAYPDKGIAAVLIIAGQPLDWDVEKRKYHKLPTATYCSAMLQGILLTSEKAPAATLPVEAAHCQGLSLDEVNFSAQASSAEHYPATASEADSSSATPLGAAESASTEEEKSLLESITNTLRRLFD